MAPPERARLMVCPADELRPGQRKVVRTERGRVINVFNVNGAYYALGNICPHQGGPLLEETFGTTRSRVTDDERLEPEYIRDGEIVRCGWHEWEFEIQTGRAFVDPKQRLATYTVRVLPAAEAGAATGDPARPTLVVEV